MSVRKKLMSASATLMIGLMSPGAFAQEQSSSEKLNLSMMTTCSCYHTGTQVSYMGDVVSMAVVETPRSEVMDRSEEELRSNLSGKQLRALEDAAYAACSIKRDRYGIRQNVSHVVTMPRVHCSSDIRFGIDRN